MTAETGVIGKLLDFFQLQRGFFALLIRYRFQELFPIAYIYKFSQLMCHNFPKLNIFSPNENHPHNKIRLRFFHSALIDIRILSLTLKIK